MGKGEVKEGSYDLEVVSIVILFVSQKKYEGMGNNWESSFNDLCHFLI